MTTGLQGESVSRSNSIRAMDHHHGPPPPPPAPLPDPPPSKHEAVVEKKVDRVVLSGDGTAAVVLPRPRSDEPAIPPPRKESAAEH